MKNCYVFTACVVFFGSSQFVSPAEADRTSSLSQKKDKGVMQRLVMAGKRKKDTSSRVSFALDKNEFFKITPKKPKMKKGKPGSRFSHDAAPEALKNDARAALAALDQAKRPVVLSSYDETTAARPLKSELLDAKKRADAPKKLAAAKKACEDVHGMLKVAVITVTRLNPVTRTDAFIVRKKRK